MEADELQRILATDGGFVKKMMEQADDPDPLDPELEDYLEYDDDLGVMMIRHPLVYSLFHTPGQNWHVNARLRQKKGLLADLRVKRNWFIYIMVGYERAYRLQAFEEIEDELSDSEYWKLLGDVWTDSENIWQNEPTWRELLTSDRDDRHAIMGDDDTQEYALLPDEIRVFRGFKHVGREAGFSWTTDAVRAKWFARRFLREGDVAFRATGVVAKPDVIAYFNGRNESEVVIPSERVRDMQIIEIRK